MHDVKKETEEKGSFLDRDIPFGIGDYVTGKDRTNERSLYQLIKVTWRQGSDKSITTYLSMQSIKFKGYDTSGDKVYTATKDEILKEYRKATRDELR